MRAAGSIRSATARALALAVAMSLGGGCLVPRTAGPPLAASSIASAETAATTPGSPPEGRRQGPSTPRPLRPKPFYKETWFWLSVAIGAGVLAGAIGAWITQSSNDQSATGASGS